QKHRRNSSLSRFVLELQPLGVTSSAPAPAPEVMRHYRYHKPRHHHYSRHASVPRRQFAEQPVDQQSQQQKISALNAECLNKPVTLSFQDIKVRAVLQLLADFTNINIVVSDSVQGSITLHLNNIP